MINQYSYFKPKEKQSTRNYIINGARRAALKPIIVRLVEMVVEVSSSR